MIELTRLNGSKLAVNPDLIKFFEAAPDTMLTLVTGEKLLVTEAGAVVAQRVMEYRAEVLRTAWPGASAGISAKSGYDVFLAAHERELEHSSNSGRG